jgi:hypothetical protein
VQRGLGHGQTGALCCLPPVKERLAAWLSIALFVVLAGYVGFSGVRLGLLLWQRFAGA